MRYFVFGLNHATAPVEIREAFELDASQLEGFYAEVGALEGTEYLVLSTCNRTEVFGHGEQRQEERIRKALAAQGGGWPADHTFQAVGDDAVSHVIEVVSGLRSQIPGDGQILHQTKQAYRAASTAGTLGPWMHRLMHAAFAGAKRIAAETGLGTTGSSVARAALETASTRMASGDGASRWTCLLLGAGRMAQLVVAEAAERGDVDLIVANRTRHNAEQIAAPIGARVVDWERRYEFSSQVDVVIGATSAHEQVLLASRIKLYGSSRQTLLIDIAVPRDIDPAIDEMQGFTVLNIDDLTAQRTATAARLEETLAAARMVCHEATKDLAQWENEHDALQPAIRTLYETFESVRRREVERNLHRFDPGAHAQVERLTRSIMQKLLAVPVVKLKTMAGEQDDLASRIHVLNDLFGRPKCEEDLKSEKCPVHHA